MIPNANIVYISLTNGAGGAEQILLMSARVTKSKIIFLKKIQTSALPIDSKIDRVKFLNTQSLFLGFIILAKELKFYRNNYIIISSHSYLNAFLGVLKRVGFLKSKLVTRECTSVFLRFSGLKRFSYKMAYSFGYPSIDLLICQTAEMKTQLIINMPFLNSGKVIVLKNPLDLEFVTNRAGLDNNDPVFAREYICTAGRLIALKGFDILISAFAEISNSYPELNLYILGEGEERKSLENLIEEFGLQKRVVLKGFISNPFPYFKHAKVCAVSSIREGFPNVLLQMMALNSSVVSTLCAEGIEDFHTIRKVIVGDQLGFAKALEDELNSSCTINQNRNLSYLTDRKPEDFINSILSRL